MIHFDFDEIISDSIETHLENEDRLHEGELEQSPSAGNCPKLKYSRKLFENWEILLIIMKSTPKKNFATRSGGG